MSSEESTFERIEEYLLGMMTHSEEEAFKSELASNPSLKSQLELHRLASNLLVEKHLLSVKSTLKEIDASSRTNTVKKIMGGATGLLLILAGTYFAFQIIPSKTPKTIAPIFEKPSAQPMSSPQNSGKEEKKEATTISHPMASTPIVSVEIEVKKKETIPMDEVAKPEKAPQIENIPVHVPQLKEAVSNDSKPESKAPSIPIDPCKLVHLTAQITTQATCTNKQEGGIYVSQLKGGELPYKTSVLNEEHQLVNVITNLSAGTYTVMITDARGCIQKFEKIFVRTKPCNHDATFNPFTGESWEIPISNQNGTLRIHDVNGNLFFEKDLKANQKEFWSGQSLHGEQKSGYFPFEIQYQDGSSTRGTITLTK